MIPLADVCLLSIAISLAVGVLIYGKNPSHVINKLFLVLCAILFYYGFVQFQFLGADNVQGALVWMRLGAFWYLLPAFEVNFSMIYANIRMGAGKLFQYSLIYIPAVSLSLFEGLLVPYQPVETP